MTTTRRLKIIVDQAGTGVAGLQKMAGALTPLKAAGGVAAGGLAVLGGATIAAGGKLISLGSEAEEMQGKFNVVFGNTAGQVTKDLDQFGNAVGRSKYDLMGMASTMGDTLKPLGFTGTALDDTTVSLVKLATDLSSFNNMPMDEAVQRLQGTLIGSHENALAFGSVINENTLKQELAAMGADNLTGKQLEQAKVQARINLLMKDTTDAQGDAERTAGSWANQTRALKAQLSESATAMGSELLPVVTPFLQEAVRMATDIMPAAVEIFGRFADDLGSNVGPAIELAEDALKRIAEAFGVNTEETSAADVALAAFEAILNTFITAVQLGALTLQGIAWAVEKVSEAVGIAQGLWDQLKTIAVLAIDKIRERWVDIVAKVKAGINDWKSGFGQARDAIRNVSDKFSDLAAKAREIANSIPSYLRPDSPTPFEIGLRGIARASKDVETRLPAAFAGVAGGGRGGLAAAGAGGGGTQVIINYNPAISTADSIEVDTKLMPLILEGMRKRGIQVSR